MLVLGGDSKFTGEQDVAEFRRLLPAARVEVVPNSGHAIQSDQPLRLTQLIEDFIFYQPGDRPPAVHDPGRRPDPDHR
jgi:pimeloyl-ACP methyl ester carboxylesterase